MEKLLKISLKKKKLNSRVEGKTNKNIEFNSKEVNLENWDVKYENLCKTLIPQPYTILYGEF